RNLLLLDVGEDLLEKLVANGEVVAVFIDAMDHQDEPRFAGLGHIDPGVNVADGGGAEESQGIELEAVGGGGVLRAAGGVDAARRSEGILLDKRERGRVEVTVGIGEVLWRVA